MAVSIARIGKATLMLGDFRLLAPGLPPVDVIVTDPPYGETSLEWDRRVDDWPSFAEPLLQPNRSMWCFGSLRFFMETAREFGKWRFAQACLWEKHNGSNAANDRFRRVHEHAAHFYPVSAQWDNVFKSPVFTNDATARTVRRKKRPPQWGDIGESVYVSEDGGPKLMRSVMFARSCHGFAIHETQKPEECYAPLIQYSCPPGGIACDIFAGSGTLATVCNRMDIESISIEKCPDRFEAMCERVESAHHGRLFA